MPGRSWIINQSPVMCSSSTNDESNTRSEVKVSVSHEIAELRVKGRPSRLFVPSFCSQFASGRFGVADPVAPVPMYLSQGAQHM